MIEINTYYGNCVTLKGKCIDHQNSKIFLNNTGWNIEINRKPQKVGFCQSDLFQMFKLDGIPTIQDVINQVKDITCEEVLQKEIEYYLHLIFNNRETLHIKVQ